MSQADHARRGIYFIRMSDYIKIGHSEDVVARWRRQTDMPLPAQPMGFQHVPMPFSLYAPEAWVHQRFKAQRFRGEWFRADPVLLDYIAAHTQPWPEA